MGMADMGTDRIPVRRGWSGDKASSKWWKARENGRNRVSNQPFVLCKATIRLLEHLSRVKFSSDLTDSPKTRAP